MDDVAPVLAHVLQFSVRNCWDSGRTERHLVFAVPLFQQIRTLSQSPCTQSSQPPTLCRAFGLFGRIRNSDKPKGASAPPGIILRFQRRRKTELIFEVQEVLILAVSPLLSARECLFL